MFTLIKNGEVYAPSHLGREDILLANGKIVQIGEIDEKKLKALFHVQVIDATKKMVLPGIIDPHVHLIGGGGEGGFATRTPELQLSKIISSGVTTLVGCLGTDGTTRHMTSLLAKARGLEEEGVSTYIYSGNYHVPTPTIMDNVKDDIILIDKVIGAGEIAISDARSAQPTLEDITKLVAEAHVGGMLGGKAGVTHFHIGTGKDKLAYLHHIIDETEIPASKIYATHITRSQALVDDAIALGNKGAFVDITADKETGSWIKYYKENGGNWDQLTVSSDGNGSMPQFNEKGEMIGLGVLSQKTLLKQIVSAVQNYKISVEDAFQLVTVNPAKALHLSHKGTIEVDKDADIILLDEEEMTLDTVIAKGQLMMHEKEVLVKGTFE